MTHRGLRSPRALLVVAFLVGDPGVVRAQSRSGSPAPPSATPADARRAIASLGDADQTTRDAAAAELRRIVAANPGIAGTAASWRRRLARFRPGSRVRDFVSATHATSDGGGSGGGGTTEGYRLDDFWRVVVVSDDHGVIRSIEGLEQNYRNVWVQPPAHFTGRWVVYFTNGVVSHDIDFVDGEYARFRAYYDNGQLSYEQRYVRGQVDGDEIGFHRDGHRAYEIHHAMGQNVGRWTHWYPNGRTETEENYVAGRLEGVSTRWREDGTRSSVSHYHEGRETGQAAWDEHGTLQYAHGTAAGEH